MRPSLIASLLLCLAAAAFFLQASALEELPPPSQADVLTKVNRYISFETETWAESAQAYLARHEATKALLPPRNDPEHPARPHKV